MVDELIRKRLLEFHEEPRPRYVRRNFVPHFVPNMVLTLVGGRKTGKTFLTYQIIDDLIRDGWLQGLQQVCSLHFDDEALTQLEVGDLSRIDEVFFTLHRGQQNPGKNTLFVFDEIHKIKGWEDFVLRLAKKEHWRVLLTGSSNQLEEDKVGRQLRGKTLVQRVYPLSFYEFLQFKGRKSSQAEGAFEEFFECGSYPAVGSLEPTLRHEVLTSYFNSVIAADLILDKNIHNPQACKAYVRSLIHKNASSYTHKKEHLSLRSQGLSIAPTTVSEWFEYAQDCYFLGVTEILSHSLKAKSQNYKKIYFLDWALVDAVSGGSDEKRSRTLETIVYWHLRRQGFQVQYGCVGKDRLEIDFVVSKPNRKPHELIQVCYDLQREETLKRELAPWECLEGELLVAKKTLLVFETPSSSVRRKIPSDITVLPVWKWLLQTEPGMN